MIFEGLGQAIGKAFSKMVDSISVKGEWSDARLEQFNKYIAKGTISEEMFKSEEFKKFSIELKEELSKSPANMLEWLQTAYLNLMKMLYDTVMTIIIPLKIKDFETAKQEAGHLTFLAIDFVMLTSILDVIATACSMTLIRNIARYGQLFISTFGFDRYFQATVAPALSASLMPHLTYGYNEQFQAQLPNIQDVIRFTVREVYDPSRRKELLSIPTPAEA